MNDYKVNGKTTLAGGANDTLRTAAPPRRESLEVYFSSNLSLKQTAERLGIHKNTLYYRFEKVKRITKLDPRSFYNGIKISLALIIHKIQGQEMKKPALSTKYFPKKNHNLDQNPMTSSKPTVKMQMRKN